MEKNILLRKLEASVLDGEQLYDKLLSLENQKIGAYRIRRLFEIGGQGVFYAAYYLDFPDKPVLIKLPYLEYHRPAYLNEKMFHNARRSICHEAYILRRFTIKDPIFPNCPILPNYIDFFWAHNTLVDPWWRPLVTDCDPYLVMEQLEGELLDDSIGYLHRTPRIPRIYRLACQVAVTFLELSIEIWKNGFGYLYTDLRPANLFTNSVSSGKQTIRVIDAGSVTSNRKRKGSPWPHHLAYVPPEFFEWSQEGEPFPPPSPEYVLYTLGRTLYQLLTAKEPLAGQEPDWEEPILEKYHPPFVTYVKELIDVRFYDFKIAYEKACELFGLPVYQSSAEDACDGHVVEGD